MRVDVQGGGCSGMAEPLAKLVGIPDEVVAQMRQAPFGPALVIAGGASARFMPTRSPILIRPRTEQADQTPDSVAVSSRPR